MPEPTDPTFVAAARFGGGFAFNGNQHISWPTALGPTTALTFELWLKPAAMGGSVLATGDGRAAIAVAGAGMNQVRISVTVAGGTIASAPVAAGTWHHVIASFSEPSLRLWVDGVRIEADTVSLAGMPIALDALTARGPGSLDEIWIAQTAITTDEAALGRYCPL